MVTENEGKLSINLVDGQLFYLETPQSIESLWLDDVEVWHADGVIEPPPPPLPPPEPPLALPPLIIGMRHEYSQLQPLDLKYKELLLTDGGSTAAYRVVSGYMDVPGWSIKGTAPRWARDNASSMYATPGYSLTEQDSYIVSVDKKTILQKNRLTEGLTMMPETLQSTSRFHEQGSRVGRYRMAVLGVSKAFVVEPFRSAVIHRPNVPVTGVDWANMTPYGDGLCVQYEAEGTGPSHGLWYFPADDQSSGGFRATQIHAHNAHGDFGISKTGRPFYVTEYGESGNDPLITIHWLDKQNDKSEFEVTTYRAYWGRQWHFSAQGPASDQVVITAGRQYNHPYKKTICLFDILTGERETIAAWDSYPFSDSFDVDYYAQPHGCMLATGEHVMWAERTQAGKLQSRIVKF